MAVKNVQIPPKKEQDKPLVICEFEGQDVTPSAIGHFHLGESEMKMVVRRLDRLGRSPTRICVPHNRNRIIADKVILRAKSIY